MTLAEAYRHGCLTLRGCKIADPHFESRVLLCHVLGLPSFSVHTNSDLVISHKAFTRFEQLLTRRLAHEPAAYITGRKEFYGIEFCVDRQVLIPRPETELLVDEALRASYALETCIRRTIRIADIGTGSGAISVALALHNPGLEIYAVDRSHGALKIAQKNALKHGVEAHISFLYGNLTTPLPVSVDVIIANLPYVADSEIFKLDQEITLHEPLLALRGGKKGLDLIEGLLLQTSTSDVLPAMILLEIGANQRKDVSELIKRELPAAEYEFIKDGHGYDRVARITCPVC